LLVHPFFLNPANLSVSYAEVFDHQLPELDHVELAILGIYQFRKPLADPPKGDTLKMPALGVPMNRLKRFEPFFLVILPLAPFLFLALVSIARTGRNLTGLFFTGLALFLAAAILLIAIGSGQGRTGWQQSGFALLVALLAVFLWGATELLWIGASTIVVTVVVRDASTKQPIPNATVRLFREYEKVDPDATEAHTDEKGTCVLNRRVTTVGVTSSVQEQGYYRLWDYLKVDAVEYQGISEKLENFTVSTWPMYGPPIPVVVVDLKKSEWKETK
jgi:hypothetical protein